ncbi:MAG: hypothetical protein K8R87_03200, partial [Verrucomicrobia bacterium]|nr:hypothetical protein [Verrucomicrobiota bacterium]
AELIAIVADVPVSAAQTLVAARNGPDGIPHTEDDQPMQSIDEAMVLLGATATTPTSGTGLFTLKGTIARVDSVGRAGNYARRISVVLRKGVDGRSPVMEWRESSGN